MCGLIEYNVTNKKDLEDHYGVKLIDGYTDQGILTPRYNIPPSAHTPLVTTENSEEIVIGHWGFKPSWAEGKKDIKEVINARAETVQEKPYFRSSIESRRCLIPVTGFFEWKREGKSKTSFRFFIDNKIFSLAGVYTSFKDERGGPLPHFAIITTRANELMSPVHDRMPVIIHEKDEKRWVSDSLSMSDIQRMLEPYPAHLMRSYQISTRINNPKNNTLDVIQPV